ncbi:uncharacterized protein OCT59_015084 [Rhizophagus irregularis]|uniref:Uncharacterized protein n=1 Tax=Rhizophagus irregularis (strain DAOM 181602 / DAOM 197198 / MUCL 43194) TaxID=747089 RepID=U9T6U6_RHIID|nr:hypothetical protein OCT59_015084 [Rhizophagus irregularis]GBC19156.2 hypothetical protein GLOIN_2v1612991 [Rhizophagus irregularis DAOM 181602=DAOM 197198]
MQRKVKKRKRQVHVIFHEKLDEKLDGKKLSDATVVSSLPSTSSVSSSTSNRRKQSPEELRGYEEEDEDGVSSSASKKARKEETPTSNVYSELAHQIIPRTDSSESSKMINDEERTARTMKRNGTDLCNALTKWKQKKARPRTDLGFYNIVDITPGSNSDFVRSLPIDVIREIRQSKHCQQLKMDDTDGMKKYMVNFIKVLLDTNSIMPKYPVALLHTLN